MPFPSTGAAVSPPTSGGKVALGIRPEDLEDAELAEAPAESRLPVTVDLREDMGAEIFLHFSVDAPHVATEDVKEAAETDDGVALEPQAENGTPFIARVDRDHALVREIGSRIAVDTRMLHFFDLDTGAAIEQ